MRVICLLQGKRLLVKEKGWWNLHLSEQDGGMGLTLCEFGQISEILSLAPYYGQYTFNCQAPDIGNTELLKHFASAEIKSTFLQPLIEGKIRSCFSTRCNPMPINTAGHLFRYRSPLSGCYFSGAGGSRCSITQFS